MPGGTQRRVNANPPVAKRHVRCGRLRQKTGFAELLTLNGAAYFDFRVTPTSTCTSLSTAAIIIALSYPAIVCFFDIDKLLLEANSFSRYCAGLSIRFAVQIRHIVYPAFGNERAVVA